MNAGPMRDLQIGKALLHGGGELRVGGDALGPGRGQRLELALVNDVRQRDDAGFGRAFDLAASTAVVLSEPLL
jgi:hypothetical protein